MCVLITGGGGYIGSHVVLALAETQKQIVIVDSLENSSSSVISRLRELVGDGVKIDFVRADICDGPALDRLFKEYDIKSVIHLAGYKSVAESVEDPVKYYRNNFSGTLSLLSAMRRASIFNLVFSSSATVYGDTAISPISEAAPLNPVNPYGRSKAFVEFMLQDVSVSDPRWAIGVLRYFNPVGAHFSGRIGEDPLGVPNNLVPFISRVAVGRLEELSIWGADYPTPDGTGVRDYVHVMDLAEGHLAALEYIYGRPGFHTWNLGAGIGYSVLEVIRAFEQASGCEIRYRVCARRPGDIAQSWADTTKANSELQWKARAGLYQMMKDTWNWQGRNPDGYEQSR
ncbi:UDP-glucose 4-epimerase GalE [Stutzerimonas degradans]|uniref:UDP-glucose 4-epimerase n=1 Tax=Stutzerimonas degradans TaxID=2968968 RepID=A0A8E2QAU3_9GAMM|nr:UDP-glucose 4-epimerase GalE [Stutzerimonas degradans]MCQ4277079.1 UDP-glucose 4-epimerase GalE [Stutzerimonas degradans]PNF75294.1 UDP-glucose 4-epimerase GalE [Stutzerimonas degradans]